jgi:tRNA (guanine-N7-)-methyltransferase
MPKGQEFSLGQKQHWNKTLTNVAFARMRIENIANFFAPAEVDEIWITFPDPFPKLGDVKRRLSAPGFIKRYQQICRPGAIVHFKTDDLPLFHFTRDSRSMSWA